MSISNKIVELRLKMNLSQQEFGCFLGFGQAIVSHWENGNRVPSLKARLAIIKLCKQMRIPVKQNEIFNM